MYFLLDENKQLMGKFAKNYLPILFNIYMMDKRLEKDPLRQLVLDTIKSYLKISDSLLCNEFLQRAFAKYSESPKQTTETAAAASPSPIPENDLFTKYSLLDLISIMVSFVNEENIQIVYDLAITGINVKFIKKIKKKFFFFFDRVPPFDIFFFCKKFFFFI